MRRAPVVVLQLGQALAELAMRFLVQTADLVQRIERTRVERGSRGGR